ncbi:hypothetical protein BDZ85DRAFT_58135 [Elsinoe ampelina]|uniref:Uncharacterized protein n=1 Tax=Elsinoe ampelina TaxID=302913 RepID=A0A6A6GMU7_9PEZI|nr:hypothetical protein BDZ85DRAFT_58135 [Elsinoe ampelina]
MAGGDSPRRMAQVRELDMFEPAMDHRREVGGFSGQTTARALHPTKQSQCDNLEGVFAVSAHGDLQDPQPTARSSYLIRSQLSARRADAAFPPKRRRRHPASKAASQQARPARTLFHPPGSLGLAPARRIRDLKTIVPGVGVLIFTPPPTHTHHPCKHALSPRACRQLTRVSSAYLC